MSVLPPQHVENYEYVPLTAKTRAGRAAEAVGRFIGGLPLGLTVLAMITIASSVGEFLDHESGQSLKLVFTQGWYRALLFIQGVSLVLNTYFTYVDTTHAQFQPILRKNPDHYKPLKIQFKVGFKEAKAGEPIELMKSLAAALAAKGYRAFYASDGLYAHRGLFARFGSTITHLGLIVIICGALVESFFKVEGTVNLAEGETVDFYSIEPDKTDKNALGFAVRLDDFDHQQYPGSGGIARKFKSTVTFISPDGKQRHEYVRVNHDVRHKGWKFHQFQMSTLEEDPRVHRYFVNLEERLPNGETKLHRLETFVSRAGREIKPIPGYDNRFFAAEDAPSGQAVLWTVASKDGVLSRGTTSLMSELRMRMIDFYPDHQMDEALGKVTRKSDTLGEPAALVEITVNDGVAFRDWVFEKSHPKSAPDKEGIALVITKVEMEPSKVGSASAAPASLMGSVDKAALAEAGAAPAGEGAVVTVEIQHNGATTDRSFKLRKGESILMGGGSGDQRLDIPGSFRVLSMHRIPTLASELSVSRNPGVPIVWVGAILATFGPVVAFFISRRRVWATIDWSKKSLILGGDSRYTREALEDEIAEVVEAWAASDEVRLRPPVKLPRVGIPDISAGI